MTDSRRTERLVPYTFGHAFDLADSLLGGLGNLRIRDLPSTGSSKCNHRVTETQHVFEFEVPGFKKEDITVDLHESTRVLEVSAKHSAETEEEDGDYVRREFSSSSFNRSFTLPENVNLDSIKVSLLRGVLEVTVDKKVGKLTGGRRLEIE